jgi:hypothetical protein
MIPADLGVELAVAISELVAAGQLPASAAGLSAAGTWRPAPVRSAPVSPAPVSPALVNPAPISPSSARPALVSPSSASPALVSPSSASPAPVGAGPSAAAGYATSLPFELARLAGEEPAAIAAWLARIIGRPAWITSAEATGAGYLTIGVTAAALAAMTVRISEAGPACVSSDALRGIDWQAPALPDLAAAATWRQAWRDQAAALAGRLALAAGATALPPGADPPRDAVRTGDAPVGGMSAGGAGPAGATAGHELIGGPLGGGPASAGGSASAGGPAAAGATVAEAVAYAGADAVRYWLARMPAARAGVLDRPLCLAREPARARARQPYPDPAQPYPAQPYSSEPCSAEPYSAPPFLARDLAAVAVARADAAATARWAAELGLARRDPPGAGHLTQPAEIVLLTQLSWLAERVAGAARRRQPAELPRYLERLARAWLDVRESSPALPFGGRDAPGDAAGTSARLWLAHATATALTAGLDLVGVGP